ncbi:MAG: ABC transporter permease [Armatimonadetes bacterium]|nr:ABC transporter permease [Armatimonadota bacterium]
MSWQRIKHIVRKEFLQIRRDPKMLRPMIIAPVFQLIVFGYAVTTDIKHISTAVYDADRTRESRELTARFRNSGYFDVNYTLARPQDIAPLLDSGRAHFALQIPRGLAKNLARGRSVAVQGLVDGADSITAGMILGYASGVVQRHSEDIVLARAQRVGAAARLPGIEERTRVWYNPELKSVNFMVPGVLCMILLVITMLMTSLSIVKEREIGTLEQLIVTPIKSTELMIAKVIPFIVIGFLDVVLILLVARLWFKVPLHGSAFLLLTLTGAFLMSSLGLGLFISTVSRNQQQAMMTSFFIMMPSILLSGFMFPIENMPPLIQYMTYLIPLRYFLNIIRGIFLKGAGFAVLWPDILPLLLFGIAILTLSSLRFHKRMG